MRPEPMTAGLLRERVRLQRPVEDIDAAGQDNYTFADVAEVWAYADQTPGREHKAAVQTFALALVVFTIRYRTDVAASWRVLWRGQPYGLVAPPIDVKMRREWLDLQTVHGIGDGAPRNGEVQP